MKIRVQLLEFFLYVVLAVFSPLTVGLLKGIGSDGSGFGEADHVDCRFGRFGAFVAEPASGSVDSLLLVVDGEHSENHRAFGIEVELCHAFGDALAYVVEVWGVAADYASDYYYGVEHWLQASCGVGEFDSSGHFKAAVCYAAALEEIGGSLGKRCGDVAVPAGGDDGYFYIF